MQLLRRGDSGPAVVEIRSTLRQFGLMTGPAATPEDDRFDADTERAVRAFQQRRGLISDGIVGQATYRALREAGWTLGDRMLALLVSAPMSGDDVLALQERLLELGFDPGRPGGVFDEQTEQALRKFQREYGLVPDGMCGPATLRSLRQLGRKVTGGRPRLMREQEVLRQSGPRLRGKRIVVDPGHGGADRGVVAAGVAEADLMWDLARRIVGRMSATGMDAMLTRQEHTCPTETERAEFANTTGADLVLSLHTDANSSMHAQGLATYHFGNGTGATSTVGEALAGFIQRELLTRTAMLDCRSQARTWELLRLTRMPTVRVEVGYLTHLGDRKRLLDPAFRDVVAEGILVAVKRLYLLGQNDQPTGTFSFSDVLAHELERGGAQAI
ncbi:N-acetylmuramoyl-L-alanine amidase [Pseudonocardia humida]|uniref:Peptidoglycan-binding protein n=1 Tax=Pseudonocardia humida TaxID=2800819 RepID=A0ABT1ABG1_9PSEU|nr:peptidoglycan-binding protein [Pseudonocardia humida]MCO1660343.1 peptidoglycan-binding protein [Pseudonocardia humida]